jgi:hypothetical protein
VKRIGPVSASEIGIGIDTPQAPPRTEAGGRKVRALKEEPQYLVKSEKSGGEAVHKPEVLERA